MSIPAPHYLLRWPDGSESQGRTAVEVILRLAAEQNPPATFQQMKDELSRRAQAWPFGTGQFIHPHQGEDPFLRELFRVGLFELEIDGVPLERA